jgi:hypothetical protein
MEIDKKILGGIVYSCEEVLVLEDYVVTHSDGVWKIYDGKGKLAYEAARVVYGKRAISVGERTKEGLLMIRIASIECNGAGMQTYLHAWRIEVDGEWDSFEDILEIGDNMIYAKYTVHMEGNYVSKKYKEMIITHVIKGKKIKEVSRLVEQHTARSGLMRVENSIVAFHNGDVMKVGESLGEIVRIINPRSLNVEKSKKGMIRAAYRR